MQNHLIIFIKNPVLGTVKTRLAKSIGDKAALNVYRDLMQKCQLESLSTNAIRHLFYSKQIIENDDWSNIEFEKKLQVEGGLGIKISEAFKLIFSKEAKVIVIGSDCYDLSADMMEDAFKKLDDSDLVIGPANDGGYYLLGTKKIYPSLFEGINWSTETVLEETLDQASKLNLSVAILEELVDLDTLEDLKKSGYQLKEIEKK
ncbi:MAG: TIGR04282 family arsenosugar biosynthesis glycosyltransferase [Flavobacteriales bacterium]|nr:TIGR04282 family arsenosugar biosynthesis glycosyltransferase [Flavobacteriales bacterium]